jgi:hypothetical protein
MRLLSINKASSPCKIERAVVIVSPITAAGNCSSCKNHAKEMELQKEVSPHSLMNLLLFILPSFEQVSYNAAGTTILCYTDIDTDDESLACII